MYWVFQRKHTLFSVRSELNNICVCSVVYYSLHSGCTMAEAVSRRPLTSETWVRSRVSRCDKVKLGQFFSEHFGFPFQYHSTSAAYSPQSPLSLPEGQTGKCWNFPKSSALLEIGELWTEKQCNFFCLKSWSVTQLLDLTSRCAPPRALSVSRPVPSQGLTPLHSTGSTSLPRPAHPPPPSGSCATDHLHYNLVMNRKRGSTP
jgi:hypothetical protein